MSVDLDNPPPECEQWARLLEAATKERDALRAENKRLRALTLQAALAAVDKGKLTAYADAALKAHMKRYAGELLTQGTFASEEFDRLYLMWTRCRWDEGHAWTRSVWKERP